MEKSKLNSSAALPESDTGITGDQARSFGGQYSGSPSVADLKRGFGHVEQDESNQYDSPLTYSEETGFVGRPMGWDR